MWAIARGMEAECIILEIVYCDIPVVTSQILEMKVYNTLRGRKGESLWIPSFR